MSLEHERPESFLGVLMALEGVSDGYTIVHGPTGCKYYPASVSEGRYPVRDGEAETRNIFQFSSRYFFSQPRIPCTYMDMGRFVTGGGERLRELYGKVVDLGPSLISVISSPGSSLVGEDLSAANGSIPTVRIDHAEYSGTCADGFQDGVMEILDTLKPVRSGSRKGVNLVGLSILHMNWKDTVNDLGGLLGLCGISVNCVIGAGWSVDDIKGSADAELNVLVYPEYGDRIAEKYLDDYSIPYVDAGVPLGFDALEDWVKQVCQKLGRDPQPALDRIMEGRRAAARSVALMESYHMLPKGHTFSMYCDGSTALAATKFLYGYLGMVPVAVTSPNGGKWAEEAFRFAEDRDIPVSDDSLHTEAEVMLTSGGLGASCQSRGLVKGWVEIETPCTKYVSVRPEPPIGLDGTLMMVDKVLNTVASYQKFI